MASASIFSDLGIEKHLIILVKVGFLIDILERVDVQ